MSFWFRQTSKWQLLLFYCLFFFFGMAGGASAQFIPRGDAAKTSGNCFRITEDKKWRYGAVWSEEMIDLNKPFELEFVLYMGTKDADGADGIAFLFHNDARGLISMGAPGRGLAFADPKGIKPSVAIEFDTWYNNDAADIQADHTAVVYNGDIDNPKVKATQIDPSNPDIENGQCHTYKISWDPQTKELQLYFDGQRRFNHEDDIVQNVFKGHATVYYGFIGSTGGYANEQSICVIGKTGVPVAEDDYVEAVPGQVVEIPVLDNDRHTGSAKLKLARIVSKSGVGKAEIKGNYIVYTTDPTVAETEYVLTYEINDVGSGQCEDEKDTAQVKIKVSCKYAEGVVQIVPQGKTTLCEGESVKLTMPGFAGVTYRWKRNGVVVGANEASFTTMLAGSYTVDVLNVCGVLTATAVAVKVNAAPAAPEGTGDERCGSGSVTLAATGGTSGAYRWYTSATEARPIAGATDAKFSTPHLETTATYYVAIVGNGCESQRVPVKATIHPIPAINPWSVVIVDEGSSVELSSAPGGATYTWLPATGLSNPAVANPVAHPAETTTYTVTTTTAAGCQSTGQVKVIVRKEIIIPNAFSPNGDGVNDNWEITTLEGYPDARVQIFDRWGNKIFEKTGYHNEWNGTMAGRPLPQSTYFYVITLQGRRDLTGSVSIVH
ncbi:lectin-like domain-containing protein [Pontibacter sp. CAU 1760]